MDARLRCSFLWLLPVVFAGWMSSIAEATPGRQPVEVLDDASLADVFFLDPDRGWAVGDRGAIWHTQDGGRNWRLQDSLVGCRLHSVWFLDGANGWAVGGWTHPYTHKSSGLVLRTHDGGQSWRPLPTAAIPTLRRLCMFDARSGWAAGAGSPQFPSAVFRTEDGGRGWAPIAGERPDGWLTGDFRDRSGGVIAGLGEVALAGANRFQAAAAPLAAGDVVRQLRLTSSNGAWLVGDAGLVLYSQNGGASWGAPANWPRDARQGFDFTALAVWNSHVWLAGSPGTRVFHSADAGATWEEFSTDQPLPLRALFFLDENRGWAVGELGAILVTRDSGRTWLRQRGPASRLAVLGFFTSPHNTPWELLVRLAGNEGYLAGAEYLTAEQAPGSRSESPSEDRVRDAMLTAGGAVAAVSSAMPEGPRLEELLVRKIRQWRPDVIMTEPSGARIEDPLRRLISQAVVQAAAAAEDPNGFPEHRACGLAPWSVKKVYAAQPPGEPGSVSLVSASLAPRVGGTLADGAARALSFLQNEFRSRAAKIELQLLMDRAGGGGSRGDVMSGIALQAGGEARRRLSDPSAGSVDLMARTAQKQHNIRQIIARAVEQSGETVVGQVDELTRDFPAAATGDVLFQLAERLRQQGRPDLAAEIYQRLVERYPQHEASEAALMRLIWHFSSSEAAAQAPRRAEFRRGVAEAVEPAAFNAPVDDENEPTGPQAAIGASLELRDSTVASGEFDQTQRDGNALALGQLAARSFPALFAEPALRFALAAAARRQGDPREAERFVAPLSASDISNPWWKCAQGEHWLMKPAGKPPQGIVRCMASPQRPYLDGILDDALWQDAEPLEIFDPGSAAAAGDAPNSLAYLARDQEYLYFAVRCRKSPGVDYAATAGPRTYDAPLKGRDRVHLRLDLDRDYGTCYRLTIDHRGWTAESCAGNNLWNPEWYVAAAADEATWTIEAAIPFRELCGRALRPREVWAVEVQRSLPAAGDAGHDLLLARPDHFGLLLFD